MIGGTGEGMMFGMGLTWIVVIVALVLAGAALAKYLSLWPINESVNWRTPGPLIARIEE